MLIALLFLTLVVYFTYRFLFVSAQTKQKVYRFLPAFIVFGLLFGLTAIFSLSDFIATRTPRTLSIITTLADLNRLRPTNADQSVRILLYGHVPSTPIETLPSNTAFLLEDDVVIFEHHKNFIAFANNPTQQAVLLAKLDDTQNVIAEVLYLGTKDQYFAFLDRVAVLPALTTLLGIIGALITWGIPLGRWLHLHRHSSSDAT